MNGKRFSDVRLSIDEAKCLIHDAELTHAKDKTFAACILMEACEDESQVNLHDMLRCLDYGGTIAEIGARCLYVRTGRDNLRWRSAGSNGLPYVVSRDDWEDYLRKCKLV